MKSFRLGIQGIAPLLLHKYSVNAEQEVQSNTRRVHLRQMLPRDAAEAVAYRLPDGQLYLPSEALHRSIAEAAAEFKQRGMRKSLKYIVPAAVTIADSVLTFKPKIKDFEVDARPVVIPATKGRVMRYRPRLEQWAIETQLDVDDEILDPDTCLAIIEVAGRRQGVGDYRPARMGPFGRFAVVDWTLLTAPAKPGRHVAS